MGFTRQQYHKMQDIRRRNCDKSISGRVSVAVRSHLSIQKDGKELKHLTFFMFSEEVMQSAPGIWDNRQYSSVTKRNVRPTAHFIWWTSGSGQKRERNIKGRKICKHFICEIISNLTSYSMPKLRSHVLIFPKYISAKRLQLFRWNGEPCQTSWCIEDPSRFIQ